MYICIYQSYAAEKIVTNQIKMPLCWPSLQSSFAAPLSYLKNPCYEACDGGYNTVRCLPFFMIIGMPKCGTTSLYFHLVQHKDVVKARKKEPMYFNRDCFSKSTERPCNKRVIVIDNKDLCEFSTSISGRSCQLIKTVVQFKDQGPTAFDIVFCNYPLPPHRSVSYENQVVLSPRDAVW